MKTILLFILLLVSFIEANEKVSLQLHWKYQFQFAGFIVAKEKGFYDEVGLDVELKEYDFSIDIVDDVANGKSTYGIYNSNILIEYLQESSIKLVSSYFKRSALVLITSQEIKNVKELVGKSIMSMTKEDFVLNFNSVLEKFDVDINELNLVKHTYKIDDFAQRRVDAMTAFISDQPYKLDKLGVKYNIINPSDYGTFNLQLELFTSNEEVLNHPDRVEKFRDASIKGWEYAFAHKEEVIELIHNKYAPYISIESLRNEALEIEKLILPTTYDIGSIDENFLHRQFQTFKNIYDVNESIVLNDFIYRCNENHKLIFTENEQEYIKSKKNEKIKICLHPNIYPIDGYKNGEHSGIMGDVYDEVAQKTGLKFQALRSVDYNDFFSKINSKACEVVSIMPTKSKKTKNLLVGSPFLKHILL